VNRRTATRASLAAIAIATIAASCAKREPRTPVADTAPPPDASPSPSSSPSPSPSPSTPTSPSKLPAFTQSDRCPSNMVFISADWCPKVERTCLHSELIKDEHITICHEFAPQTKCVAPVEARSFCIDRFEFPNVEGGHPPWMVTWYDAEQTCKSKGKRTCYESEWTMACEGPERTPFPNGYERDNTACNIDNEYIRVNVPKMYSKDASMREPELERIDQSVASGSMPRCVSGYGVYDTTGNFDEWVTREASGQNRRKDDKSLFAGLKGGAWGHVRNACRPMTTSHVPDFAYYFVAFRCCADPIGDKPWKPKNAMLKPNLEAIDKAPIPHPAHPTGPSPTKVKKDRGY
jgi:hypothetical protein